MAMSVNAGGRRGCVLLFVLCCSLMVDTAPTPDDAPETGTCSCSPIYKELRCHGLQTLQSVRTAGCGLPVKNLLLFNTQITTLESGMFLGLAMKKLLLHDSNITSVSADAFDGLESLESLILESKLSEVPVALKKLPQLRILSLMGNTFGSVKKDSFSHMSNLATLILLNNGITNVESGAIPPGILYLYLRGNNFTCIDDVSPALQKLSKLRSLNLGYNRISHFTKKDFSGYIYLDSLVLSENGIKSIPSDAFAGLESLKRLDLDGNSISDTSFLRAIPHIRSLHLARNKMQTLNGEDFEGLVKLQSLHLDGNEFTRVPHIQFIENLGQLSISDNHIAAVDWSELNHLSKLTTLDLTNNEIITMHNKAMLPRLRIVLLGCNMLRELNGSLYNLKGVTHLNISNNQLKAISNADVPQSNTLRYINIADNPLQCNDQLKQLMDTMKKSGVVFATSGDCSEMP